MWAMWAELEISPKLKHCFFIPCDSHGLQLLVKDLLSLPFLKDIVDKGQCIVKSFRHAPLQDARLRQYQEEYHRKQKSLVLSVITRWGTQYHRSLSLLNSKGTIKQYCAEVEHQLTNLTCDDLFWHIWGEWQE
jgi:hypothetical protein